jgi:hypothetical protein
MQKLTIYVSILLLTGLAFSQTFTLQHHFLEGNAEIVHLDNSGDKYLVVDRTNNIMNFYNLDYTIWKSVSLAVPEGYTLFSWSHISETKINSDSNIEIAYVYKPDNVPFLIPYSRIISEDGTILMSDDFVFYQFSNFDGLETRLYFYNSGSTSIFSLSGLTLQTVYPGQLTRANLELSGEKYYYYDNTNNSLELLNIDFTLWKSIPLPTGVTNANIQFISENQINSDPLIEICYTHPGSCNVINENGSELLTVPDGWRAYVDKIVGLENKLFVQCTNDPSETTKIYSLPSLVFEHEYDGETKRIKLEISGEKYYVPEINGSTSNQVVLYHSNHDFWKSIFLPVPPSQSVINVGGVSETIFADDNKVEVVYTTKSVLLDTFFPESIIINESGQILFSEYLSSALVLDVDSGSPRLISQRIFGEFNIITREANVYAFDSTMGISENIFDKTSIYPNPSSSGLFYIQGTSRRITTLEIISLSGQTIDQVTGTEISSFDHYLSPGIYLMRLTDSMNNHSIHKIVVASN